MQEWEERAMLIEEAQEEARREAKKETENRINQLIQKLMKLNRTEDLAHSTKESEYQKQLRFFYFEWEFE